MPVNRPVKSRKDLESLTRFEEPNVDKSRGRPAPTADFRGENSFSLLSGVFRYTVACYLDDQETA